MTTLGISLSQRIGRLLVGFTIAFLTHPVVGQESVAGSADFFEKRVRPVLVERCHECHSGEEPESELNAESLAGLLRGGKRGPAIVPGDPEHSLMILAVNHADQLHMPPKSKIPSNEIGALTEWVKAGAKWPDAEVPTIVNEGPASAGQITDQQRRFWAFQAPLPQQLPSVRREDWVQSPIDRFILARLESAGLEPAPPVDARTWLRRVTFDLTGLPPTLAEVSAFVVDQSPDARVKVVDRLLASPRYGERWGRAWLDVARYADSNGLDENLSYANAFRYRDYVIAAFNQDKPYDRFLVEQIAGDLLPAEDAVPIEERLAATGFLSLGAKMLAEDDPVKMQMDIIDEQIDTVGRSILGLTLGCARCHDHKFDPIPTADYYALAGIFKSTRTMENFKVVARWQERPLVSAAKAAERDEIQARIDGVTKEIETARSAAIQHFLREARRHVGDYLLAAQHQSALAQRVASATSIGDLASADGALIIEAENYDRGNVLKDINNYGAGIGVLVNAGELPNFAEYEFIAPAPGVYQVELRFAAEDSRPCSLIVNNRSVTSSAAAEVTGSWFPEGQQWKVEGFTELKAGRNVVRLEQPQCFPHIDKLLFAPVTDVQLIGERIDSQYELIPEFTEQWVEQVQNPASETNPLISLWQRATNGSVENETADLAALRRELNLGDGAPKPADIARSIQDYAMRLDAQRPKEAGIDAAQLSPSDNPSRDAIEALLYGPTSPYQTKKDVDRYFPTEAIAPIAELERQQKEMTASRPTYPEAMAVSNDSPQNVRIHIRGSHITLGPEVPRGFPQVIKTSAPLTIAADQSGRLELAHWLTQPDQPLTARVMVNRLWQAHFGEGLVRSPDNFGTLGETPTHPELLDYLALRFIEEEWSLKALQRQIVLSSTYEMSSEWNGTAAATDPENRLYWRRNRRRLEAEAIRDAILAVSGSLDLTMGGTMLVTKNREYVTSTANVDPVVYRSDRRSVYLPVVRSALYDVFQAFDFPDPSVANGRRESTTVAPQALFMMNSSIVAENSGKLAQTIRAATSDNAERVRQLFERAYSRDPSAEDLESALAFVQRLREEHKSRGADDVTADLRAWQSLCRVVISANEFIFVE